MPYYNGYSYYPPPSCLSCKSGELVFIKQLHTRICYLLYMLSNQTTLSRSISHPTLPLKNPESFLLEHTFSFLFLLLKVLIISPVLT